MSNSGPDILSDAQAGYAEDSEAPGGDSRFRDLSTGDVIATSHGHQNPGYAARALEGTR